MTSLGRERDFSILAWMAGCAQEPPPSRLPRTSEAGAVPPNLEGGAEGEGDTQVTRRKTWPEQSELSERGNSSDMQSNEGSIDPDQVLSVRASHLATGEHVNLSYRIDSPCGVGSFGQVSKVELYLRAGQSQVLALKRTRQDRRFKNRELSLMKAINHPNIIRCFYAWQERSNPKEPDEVTLYLLLEYVPDTLYKHYRIWAKKRIPFPELLCKVYLFQLLRALAWLHAIGVCHRDLKPHNILIVNEQVEQCSSYVPSLIFTDFGSAKVLKTGETNVSYTCSRYYRAPELIFGSTHYDHAVDMWSVGCIFGELLAGTVFFPGGSTVDQLVEIIKVLGTPTKSQIRLMNPDYQAQKFPQIKSVPFSKLLPRASSEAVSFLSGLLCFGPRTRLSASEAMAHPFFDEIKGAYNLFMPNGSIVDPRLFFSWSREELSARPEFNTRYIPPYFYRTLFEERGIDLMNFKPVDLSLLQVDID
ncbi:hypothetical protein JCM5353_004537 [Sporobolomyces roseus]